MASSSRLRRAAPISDTGASAGLPADELFEVLLRLPAKDLCRLRAVCRSWRALTYDPHFATVHKSRHAEPLFAFTFRDGDSDDRGIAIVGLSGQVLRRIPFGSDCIKVLLTHLDRLCVIRYCKPSLATWVLNPATAVALNLPGPCSDEFVGRCCPEHSFDWGYAWSHDCKTVTYAFGQVACTGSYKVLRISHPDRSQSLLCDILTLDEGSWRTTQNPPSNIMRPRNHKRVENMKCLGVNGVVYFFFDFAVMEPASIAPFDLDTEKWMPVLRGPEPLRSVKFDLVDRSKRELSLANLNSTLVIVDNDVDVSFDLWFLVDQKRGLWVKNYTLSIKQCCPLLILDDGRIVIFEMLERLLQCYDPTTSNLVDVLDIRAMGLAETQSIGVYTGSLLI